MVALIRHGQTDWNRDGLLQGVSDIPLNAVGRDQALAAARKLVGSDWNVVVSSPLARARETAQIIAGELGLGVAGTYAELMERDYGTLEGTPSADAIKQWPSRDYPGAESLADVAARGRAALTRIREDLGDLASPLIVAHGTLIRYTLAALAGRPVPGIENGSISRVRREGSRWVVESVNGVPLAHIPEAAAARDASRAGELQGPAKAPLGRVAPPAATG